MQYSVSDGYLRFWLRFIAPGMEQVMRGRGDLVAKHVAAEWPRWRSQAIEPLVRESVARTLPDPRFGDARYVGSYWSRTGDVEADLIGADRPAAPAAVSFIGSVKWRNDAPFARPDLRALAAAAEQVPGGTSALLVGVSRSGFSTEELDVALTANDLIDAWNSF